MYDIAFTTVVPETRIYEMLSTLMNLLKKLLNIFERISSLQARQYDTQDSLQQLINILKEFQFLSGELSSPTPEEHSKTFQRFIGRLLQTISLQRHKFVEIGLPSDLIELTNDLQNSIAGYNRDGDLPKVLKKIIRITIRFYKLSPQTTSSPDSLSLTSRNFSFNEMLNETTGFSPTKKMDSQPESPLTKIMLGISKNYKTLSCLDLDYRSFRNIVFQAKGQKNQAYQDELQRNHTTMKTVDKYSKDFRDHLNRKQIRRTLLFRKTKLNENKTVRQGFPERARNSSLPENSIFNLQTSFQKTKISEISPLQIKRSQKMEYDSSVSRKTNSEGFQIMIQKQRAAVVENRIKNAYHLKHVMISGSKVRLNSLSKNRDKTNSISSIHNKKMALISGPKQRKYNPQTTQQMYFGKLKRNLQQMKQNNNILVSLTRGDEEHHIAQAFTLE